MITNGQKTMWRKFLPEVVLGFTLVLSGASFASAAEVVASAQPINIAIGESAQISIDLVLTQGEDASVFEGFFDLIGDATIVVAVDDSSIVAGGPTWSSAFGSAGSQLSIVSLTSSNQGGTRLVGILTVVGQSAGTFELRLGSGTSAARDVAPPVYQEDVPITTPVGTTLATVQVTGAPSVPGLTPTGLGLGVVVLMCVGVTMSRTRRRATG